MTVGNPTTGNPTRGYFVHLSLSPVGVGFFRTDNDSRQTVWTGDGAVGKGVEDGRAGPCTFRKKQA